MAATPRPEHPRPDAVREHWVSLNGEWQFEFDDAADGESRGLLSGHDYSKRIQVPFAVQSPLSGIGDVGYHKDVWYRRLLSLPKDFEQGRVLLHFGAVDYLAKVYLNGSFVGSHQGGSAAFSFDITDRLRPGENELVVRVHDDLKDGVQPKGKQALKSEGCMYTGTTGLWQTVWLERVGTSYVENFAVETDPVAGRIIVTARLKAHEAGLSLKVSTSAAGKPTGEALAAVDGDTATVVIPLTEKRLWDTATPFLYDLKVSLDKGDKVVDSVSSYFGLRSVTISGRRILINGKPVFQRLILDQGFYPDGIWTAPSDEELKQDILRSMAAGFNGARLHQKVFEPRFLYWADKLGYLVWGEFPSWGADNADHGHAPWANEWMEILQRDRNHPAIIGWCPYNETGGEATVGQQLIWNLTRAIDPSRPVLETSGWKHTLANALVRDSHDYDQNPQSFEKRWRDYFKPDPTKRALPPRYFWGSLVDCDLGVPFMISEYGGIAWNPDGAGWGYGDGPKTLEEFYARYKGLTDALLDNPDLFGFCYTQLTDVEQERNGLYFYDRRPKFDNRRLHAITSRKAVYEEGAPQSPIPALVPQPDWRVIVGAQSDGPANRPYRVATAVSGDTWKTANFDDSAWPVAQGPFGEGTRGAVTPFKSGELFLRQTFHYDGLPINDGALVVAGQGPVDVYLNGELVATHAGSWDYRLYPNTELLRKVLKKGDNLLALHATYAKGELGVDFALLVE